MPASDLLFVPTDGEGIQRHGTGEVRWPLPGKDGPGEPVANGEGLVLLDLEGLLGELGERIYVAEWVEEPQSARLVSETSWDPRVAAKFALDCAEHAISDAGKLKLPSGSSLGDVLAAASRYLEAGGDTGAEQLGLLRRVSRIAQAHRLRKLGTEMASVAFEITREDEREDLDALDDPAFTSVASARDAVLAVVEAVHHAGRTHLFADEEGRYEEEAESAPASSGPIGTPWGSFSIGRGALLPAWVAARNSAERARQAVGGEGEAGKDSPASGGAELSFQLERLAEALGTG